MSKHNKIKNLKELQHIEYPIDLNAAWQGVEGALNASARRRRFFYWLSAAGVILLACFSYHFLSVQNKTDKLPIVAQQSIDKQATEKIGSEEKATIAENSNVSAEGKKVTQENNQDKKIRRNSFITNVTKEEKTNSQTVQWQLLNKQVAYVRYELLQNDMVPLMEVKEIAKPIKQDARKGLRVELFATTSPSIVNKILKADDALGWMINKDFNSVTSTSERATAGVQANLGVQFNIGEKWFVQTGLGYSEKREYVKYNHTIKEFAIVREAEQKLDYAPLSPQQWVMNDYQGNNSYKFVEIPLLFGTQMNLSDKIQWKIRGGAAYWRLIDKSGEKIDPTSLIVNNLAEIKNYRKNNIGILLNTGFYYNLNPSWSLLAEPGASLAISNLTQGSPVKTKPYNYGLNIGVQYKLK